MSWFDIIKLANVGGFIESRSYEGRMNKLLLDFEKKRITAEEYRDLREALREQFGKMLEYDFN